MHTASGLLHADHRLPSLDYDQLLRATAILTKDQTQVERVFRQAVFNVLAHNRDDHAKNFSFLMRQDGTWIASPAYDLTFSAGVGDEHSMMVAGEGRHPSKANLLGLARKVDIDQVRCLEIIEQTRAALNQWQSLASDTGVSSASTQRIKQSFEQIQKQGAFQTRPQKRSRIVDEAASLDGPDQES